MGSMGAVDVEAESASCVRQFLVLRGQVEVVKHVAGRVGKALATSLIAALTRGGTGSVGPKHLKADGAARHREFRVMGRETKIFKLVPREQRAGEMERVEGTEGCGKGIGGLIEHCGLDRNQMKSR